MTKKIKIERFKLFSVEETMNGLKNNLNNIIADEDYFDISYTILNNIKNIKEDATALREVISNTPEYIQRYEKERIGICEKHSKKDEDGNPIQKIIKDQNGNVIQNEYDIEDMKEFENDIAKLKEKYKTELEQFEQFKNNMEKFLHEIIEINITPLKKKWIKILKPLPSHMEILINLNLIK